MLRNTLLRKGVGPLTLGAFFLAAAVAHADDSSPLARQLAELGRQARAQGDLAQAKVFFAKAMRLDPGNAEIRRVSMQVPAPAEGSPAAATERGGVDIPVEAPGVAAERRAAAAAERPPGGATLEEASRLENVIRQQLTDDVHQRLKAAQDQVNASQPEAALNTLRLAQNVVRSADQVDEATKTALDRQIQSQLLSTVRAEERIVGERAERLRLEASGEQQTRALELLARNQATGTAMMTQFNHLMSEGFYNVLYNGGTGDINAATTPFYDARLLAQQVRALDFNDPTGYAGVIVAEGVGFLSQDRAFRSLGNFRAMMTLADVSRASVPFPDNKIIEYPPADAWRVLSERRIKRYGKAVDLVDRDPKTKNILDKLDEPISMSFGNETPLEDVLKYIKSATQGPNDSGIPIYVDPIGLQEAEKTMTSTVTLDLEGVPLKTTLRLILKQLSLAYTVKDGLLTITAENSEDQPTEIRVYPVADLAIIPISLMGGGGGMMGGGMGGMGGGMGGMGGGMGGMGGGMGGMGGGGMGGGMGMMSIAPRDPSEGDQAPSEFLQKKRS